MLSNETKARIARVHRIIEAGKDRAERLKNTSARNRLEEIQLVIGYAEPGYGSGDEDVILLGNWNPISHYHKPPHPGDNLPERIGDLLEKTGVNLEWSDEWDTCSNCSKAVRTEADSYSWTRSFYMNEDEGELICEDCTKENPETYLESLEGDHRKAITMDIDPKEFGYKLVSDDFEHGFYGGQDSDPKSIAKALKSRGISRYLFKIESVGQFDSRFSLWVHESETLPDLGPDDKECKAASTGEAEVKRVSPEDFIEGNL